MKTNFLTEEELKTLEEEAMSYSVEEKLSDSGEAKRYNPLFNLLDESRPNAPIENSSYFLNWFSLWGIIFTIIMVIADLVIILSDVDIILKLSAPFATILYVSIFFGIGKAKSDIRVSNDRISTLEKELDELKKTKDN